MRSSWDSQGHTGFCGELTRPCWRNMRLTSTQNRTAPRKAPPIRASQGVYVAAEKALILRVKVPSCQWPDSDTSRYHSPCWVTTRAWCGVHGPAAQKTSSVCGRSNLGASRVGEPEHEGMTAAPQWVRQGSCSPDGRVSAPNLLHVRWGRCSSGSNGHVHR